VRTLKTTVVVVACYALGTLIIVPGWLWVMVSDFNWASAGVGLVIVLAWLFGYFPVVGGLVGLLKIRRLMKVADQALSEPGETSSTWEELLIERLLEEVPVPGFIAEPIVQWLVRHTKRRVHALKMGP
jgi:TRAP-type C4-dicarboxylate transport system permease small subunit